MRIHILRSAVVPIAMSVLGCHPAGPTTAVLSHALVSPPLVFDGVTVIDVRDGRQLLAQRVVIVGNRIRTVGSVDAVSLPAGAQVVDARGKFLIPGLWDMHTHSRRQAAWFYPLFVANGVTGIRDAWSEVPVDTLQLWRREILAGTRLGPPRQLLAGPALDEATPCVRAKNQGHLCVADPADARHVVDSLKAAGVDFLKMYGLGHDLYFAIAADARRIGLPFGGHLGDPRGFNWDSDSASVVEASDSGASIVDHWQEAGDIRHLCFDRRATVARCQLVADHFRRNGTWLVPTLLTGALSVYRAMKAGKHQVIFIGGTRLRTPEARMLLLRFVQVDSVFLAGTLSSGWLHTPPGGPSVQTDTLLMRDPMYGMGRSDSVGLMRLAHRVGLPLLAGTDVMRDYAVAPGLSLHTELALLVAEGLTPLEALQAATLNPARYLHGLDSLGTVASGKLADLVLLDANPLVDITNTTAIRSVVANGRYYDRAALDGIVRGAQAQAKHESQHD